ncbi:MULTISPECIES: flavodoxin [unclassified Enterococcus]|uniref:flavodoxin n=1 Tax=unclassified Enterococcus TaxID=2608891 RepID=UPI0013EDB0C0|nr:MULTISPECIES: flavodoxin [unclassified Enterococcus]
MAIIIYFSRSGENFVHGKIKKLPVGHTQIVAEKIADLLQATLLSLQPLDAYPRSYKETIERAVDELGTSRNLEIEILPEDLSQDEVVFLGYPNWCNTLPAVVTSFLRQHDLSGKTIYPFCTHEGSGFGSSLKKLKTLCPEADVKTGLAIRGSRAEKSDKAIQYWLSQVGSLNHNKRRG